MPVTAIIKKAMDRKKVIRRLHVTLFETRVLYQCLCRLTWAITDKSQMKDATTWATPQLCHVSWLVPCPAMCSPMPVTADATNANGNNRSMRNAIPIFIVQETDASGLKKTPWRQVFIHLLHPIQASAFSNITCLCPKKPLLSNSSDAHQFLHKYFVLQNLMCYFVYA